MAPRKTRGGGTPESVKKAAEAASELHKEVYGSEEPDTQKEATQEAAPEGEATAKGGDIQPVETPAPAESAENTDPPASPPEAKEVTPSNKKPDNQPEVDWEGKYKVLQGKYNAEVPRLNAQLRELQGQVQQLMNAPKPEPVKMTGDDREQESVVSEQDLVDYGDDLVDLIRRVARAEAAEKTKDLTPTIEEIRGQVQKSNQRQVTNSVYSKLDAEVQDWKEINKSPDFVGWLQDLDPYAGSVRQNLLSDAFAQGDGDRVVAFFKGYLAEQQAVSPPKPSNPEPAAQPQVRLEELAGPKAGSNGSSAPPQQPHAPQWTRAQIGKFYDDVHKGHYRLNPEKKAQIEASIAQAMAAGAVQ